MQLKAPDSLRTRFLLAGLAAGAASILGSLFLAYQAETLLLDNLRLSSLQRAVRTAFLIAPLLEAHNHAEIARKLDLLQAEGDLVAGAVYDKAGRSLARTGDSNDRSCRSGTDFVSHEFVAELHVEGPIGEAGQANGCLHLIVSKQRPLEMANRLWGTAFAAAAITFLVSLLAAVSLSRLITAPLRRLARAAARVGRGDLDTHIETDAHGEFGVVARAFESMTAELRKSTVSKSHLDNLINALGESLIVCDEQGIIQSANQAACQLLGYGFGDLEGMPMGEVLDGGMLDPEHEFSVGVERQYITSRGGRIPVLTTVTAMRSQGERLLVNVAQDLTQRKEIEEAMLAAREAAESANLAKSQFLANMTHELRTPLNSIISFAGLLEEEMEDRDLDELLPDARKITRAGRHLLAVVNDVLDLSKVEAGRMTVHMAPFSVSQAVRDVVETAEPLAGRNGNRIVVHPLPEREFVIHSDEQKFRQSLMNLVSNACKFTEAGDITIKCQLLGEQGSRQLQVKVTDSGIGMSPEEVGRLFQPFTQVDASAGRRFGGTGLGLVITHRFCRAVGGDLTVESEPGRGSTFTISLPVTAQASDKVDGEPRQALPAA
ncbi:MAG: PAS domain S-box protein [Bryobacterales bacterium]|nr:PAS domain S-box protein [Bryobacterales bacterium]